MEHVAATELSRHSKLKQLDRARCMLDWLGRRVEAAMLLLALHRGRIRLKVCWDPNIQHTAVNQERPTECGVLSVEHSIKCLRLNNYLVHHGYRLSVRNLLSEA